MNIVKKIEALLYTNGEPIKRRKLMQDLSCEESELEESILELKESKKDGGVVIFDDGESISLRTNPEIEADIKELRTNEIEKPLSKAARETLSAIAYISPITKNDLDFLRGVNTQFIVRRLLMRGLIREIKDGPKRQFAVTDEFLSHMGITEISKLKDYEETRKRLLDGISSIKGRLSEENGEE